jgi:hypothetical protein
MLIPMFYYMDILSNFINPCITKFQYLKGMIPSIAIFQDLNIQVLMSLLWRY